LHVEEKMNSRLLEKILKETKLIVDMDEMMGEIQNLPNESIYK